MTLDEFYQALAQTKDNHQWNINKESGAIRSECGCPIETVAYDIDPSKNWWFKLTAAIELIRGPEKESNDEQLMWPSVVVCAADCNVEYYQPESLKVRKKMIEVLGLN
jgi:hypothetical protein